MKFSSDQAVFDHVVTSLVKQGQPSMTLRKHGLGLVCAYRGQDGRKCAAGWCIADEEYSELMEGGRIRSLIGADSGVKTGVKPLGHLFPHAALLDDLQRAHDDPAVDERMFGPWLQAFVTKARTIADKYKLKESALNNAIDVNAAVW